jgi:hypothetical protein
MCKSEWQTPERVMRISTSVPWGLGVSESFFCSGWPCSTIW